MSRSLPSRVVIVSTELPPGPGGIGTHAHRLATGLTQRGWQVTVVAAQDYVTEEEAVAFRAAAPYAVVPFAHASSPASRWVDRARRLRRTLRQSRPDVVVATGDRAVWLTAALRRRRWVAVGHGGEFGAAGVRARLSRWAYGRASAVVCVSEFTAGLMDDFGIRPPTTEVILNGADVGDLRSAPRLSPEEAPAWLTRPGPLLVTVGNVTERKGQEVVVRALPEIVAQHPTAHYVAVGLPTDAPQLRALARSLGVEDHLTFAGRADDATLAATYDRADLFLMTSRSSANGDVEGLGIAVLEAALFGCPAIVSRHGGLPEAVEDGVTGLVVPESDPSATAAAACALLGDPERRAEMGVAAAERARRVASWDGVTAAYERVLRHAGPPSTSSAQRRLVMISDTPHNRDDGVIVGWEPTVREVDELSRFFAEVVHVAPLDEGPAPRISRAYGSPRVRLRGLAPAGGETLRDKVQVLARYPQWAKIILEETRDRDSVIHVRGPSNVQMLALVLLLVTRRKVPWAKYAGNWKADTQEAWSYRLQHWWVERGLHGGITTINGRWPDQPSHCRTFFNPTFTDDELAGAQAVAATKTLTAPVRLLLVGRLHRVKGVDRAMEITVRLRDLGHDVHLDIAGDGPEADALKERCVELGAQDVTTFHGWMSREELGPLYAAAHFFVLPTTWEGFAKVLAEAMAHGAVTIAGAVASIPQAFDELGAGVALPPLDIDAWVDTIGGLISDPDRWAEASAAGPRAASRCSYRSYIDDVADLFAVWGIRLDEV